MDTHTALKFLHVGFAIAWLAGAFTIILLGFLAERARDATRLMTVMDQIVTIARWVFIPGSGLVLLFGVLMVWTGGLAWGDAWIILELLGILVTGGLGARVLTPLAERAWLFAGIPGRLPEAFAAARWLLAVAKFGTVLLFSIVLLMVAKPGWSDWPVLLVVAAALAPAWLAFLRPRQRMPVPA